MMWTRGCEPCRPDAVMGVNLSFCFSKVVGIVPDTSNERVPRGRLTVFRGHLTSSERCFGKNRTAKLHLLRRYPSRDEPPGFLCLSVSLWSFHMFLCLCCHNQQPRQTATTTRMRPKTTATTQDAQTRTLQRQGKEGN